MKTATVFLTLAQAYELRHAAGAGYADGDLYGLNDDPKSRAPDAISKHNVFLRGMGRLEDAIEQAEGAKLRFRFTNREGG